MSEMPSAAGSAVQAQEKINGSAFYEEGKMMEINIWGFIACIFFAAFFGVIFAALMAGRKREGLMRRVAEVERALNEERKKNFELETRLPRRIKAGTVRADIEDFRSGAPK